MLYSTHACSVRTVQPTSALSLRRVVQLLTNGARTAVAGGVGERQARDQTQLFAATIRAVAGVARIADGCADTLQQRESVCTVLQLTVELLTVNCLL